MRRENLFWLILGIILTLIFLRNVGDDLWGDKSLTIPQSVEIHLDTLEYKNPPPLTIRAAEGVIRTVQPEPDTAIYIPPPVIATDSIYTFADTLAGRWKMEIEGRDVRLRSLLLVDRLEKERTISYLRPAWEVSLMSSISPHTQWFGVGIARNFNRSTITIEAGYDPYKHSPHLELSASFRLWSRR